MRLTARLDARTETMSSKALTLGALALSAVFLASPVMAFSVEQAPTNSDGTARFQDPDEKTDQIQQRYQDTRDNRGNWYGNGRQYQSSFGAEPRYDQSYWGSSMLESPKR